MRKAVERKILVLILFAVLLSGLAEAQNTTKKWYAGVGIDVYNAYSQQKNSMPMKMGYPTFKSVMPELSAGFIWEDQKLHEVKLEIMYSGVLQADDGLGENYILQSKASSFFNTRLNYGFYGLLWHPGPFQIDLGPVGGLEYQRRMLTYKSGIQERSADVNLFVGPQTRLFYETGRISFEVYFASMFYLPFSNFGKLKKWNAEGELITESNYYAFYYRTVFGLSAGYSLNNADRIGLGVEMDDVVGFANRERIFYIDDLVHFRLNKSYRIVIRYYF
ncbi:MAG: hypothetical protein K9G67_04480 [Bacteroidales bacterium]|nr:hypothetical protein [Bacteroidales bacterium]MCF8351772.1 hypothetical protein [Bacteroidales bacterium]MCF8375589.1 hypothetical protein [Bacteroidales bacterium]